MLFMYYCLCVKDVEYENLYLRTNSIWKAYFPCWKKLINTLWKLIVKVSENQWLQRKISLIKCCFKSRKYIVFFPKIKNAFRHRCKFGRDYCPFSFVATLYFPRLNLFLVCQHLCTYIFIIDKLVITILIRIATKVLIPNKS